MSRESFEDVSEPWRDSLRFAERVVLRFPRLIDTALRFLVRLPAEGQLRRRLLLPLARRMLRLAGRPSGLRVMQAVCEPDVEFNFFGFATATGIQERYVGPNGLQAFTEEWTSQMDWPAFAPTRVVDFGDKFLLEATFMSRGRTSGAGLSRPMGYVIHLSERGRVARVDAFWERYEALEAVGLRE